MQRSDTRQSRVTLAAFLPVVAACIFADRAAAQSNYSIHFATAQSDASVLSPNDFPADGDGGTSSIEGAAGIYGNTGWINIPFGFTQLIETSSPTGIVLVAETHANGAINSHNSFISGDNGDLMNSYQDSANGGTYTFTGLNPAQPYNVVIYHNGVGTGAVTFPTDGGTYTLTSPSLPASIAVSYIESAPFLGTFVVNEDYHVIPIAGLSTFTLTVNNVVGATPFFATPVNGIEIVPVPEPACVALLAFGGIARRRRRR